MRDPILQSRAREMRREQPLAEQRLWFYLRRRYLAGCKFRRQVPVGPYIADFVCLSASLIVELDGSQHKQQIVYDTVRSDFLCAHGFHVMRFWNNDVLREPETVAGMILDELKRRLAGNTRAGFHVKKPPP